MKVIVILIIISTLVAIGFLVAFLWATKSGQFDDLYSPSVRMLFDEKSKKKQVSSTKNQDSDKEPEKDKKNRD